MVGKLERVTLREVFPHEAHSLTKWLLDNSDVISEAIGRSVQLREREHTVGSFSADLLGEDEEGNIVIVENQLEKSDHDHLGKLLTYVSGTDAKSAIWIVSEARPEHLNAINWLNEAGLCAFYLFKIEAVRIGTSDSAPLLTKITGPSEELRAAGHEKKQLAQRHIERNEFWEALLPLSNAQTPLFANVSPGPFSYLSTGAGRAGTSYVYRLTRTEISVELYFGDADADRNSRYFQELLGKKAEIEKIFGGALEWDDMKDAKACRIRFTVGLGGYKSERDNWPKIMDAAVNAMVLLEKATRATLSAVRAQ